ncbi:MAG: lipopolysaccharide transport system permease protein [Gammaproteobacteria bacterium]|jgi:lipopolysaccharide transport system permease protein
MKITVEAGRTEKQYWKDIWRYRELFFFLAWRDLLVRYKQTIIGISWALIRPLLTMAVLTVVFGKIANLPSGGVPYPILVFAALMPWQFFASAFSEAGNSLINNSNMISKVYFPRLTIPVSVVMVNLVDFLISLILMVVLMVFYGHMPGPEILVLPLFIVAVVAISVGSGLWVAALNVKYRDFRYVIPFVVQFGLYISPVGFSSDVVPSAWRLAYSLNPMVGVIDGFRWTILGGSHEIYMPGFVLSMSVAVLILVSGISYFRRTEKLFADVI